MEKDNARLECMIDIETLGLKPNSLIASIGAIIFDAEGFHADRFFARLDLQPQLELGMKVDGSTIAWWMKQGDAARADAFGEPTDASMFDMLTRFGEFISYNKPATFWAKSPQFDMVLLEALYDGDQPWGYRDLRDVRTLLSLVPEDAVQVPAQADSEHKALDDAAYQVAQVTAAYKWLQGLVQPEHDAGRV